MATWMAFGVFYGNNVQQRVEITTDAVSGTRYVVAVLVANGPMGESRRLHDCPATEPELSIADRNAGEPWYFLLKAAAHLVRLGTVLRTGAAAAGRGPTTRTRSAWANGVPRFVQESSTRGSI